MRLSEHTIKIENGTAHFSLVSQSGHLVQPVTMGVGAARELATELMLAVIRYEREEAAPGLVGRIAAAEMVAALSEDDCGSMLTDNDWDGLA